MTLKEGARPVEPEDVGSSLIDSVDALVRNRPPHPRTRNIVGMAAIATTIAVLSVALYVVLR